MTLQTTFLWILNVKTYNTEHDIAALVGDN